jgi:hypothetical protein
MNPIQFEYLPARVGKASRRNRRRSSWRGPLLVILALLALLALLVLSVIA